VNSERRTRKGGLGGHAAWSLLFAAGCAGCGLTLAGCASTGPKSTVLTASDLDTTTAVMAQKLSDSRLLAERTPDSPKMTIAISKVQNLTSDIITEGEQWSLMEKVRGSLPIVELGKQKNLTFVIPAEHLRSAQAKGTLPTDFASGRKPTHEMDATFRSATRSGGLDRTDAYLVEYRITDLASGELVWDETFEFKRVARGLSYD
jgi:hypothetical protein